MGSSSILALSHPCFTFSEKPTNPHKFLQIKASKTQTLWPFDSFSFTKPTFSVLQKSLPLATSALILLSSYPAKAGFLSGLSGIESVPGPQLPQIDFLNRLNEENQKKYAESDAKFKESPLLKQLLERSKLNKEKNQQKIQDKYCLRGAEWGVGDCSADGMSPEDRDSFITMLKKKAGVDE